MKNINWGIIGLGNIAKSFSEGFFEADNSKLLAISSLNKQKINFFKNRFKIDKKFIFREYEDLLNCSEVDVVYITLPNNFHYEWINKSIKKNKNILVEKPAFIFEKDAKDIIQKIQSTNLLFSEGYMYRYNPLIYKVVEIIKSAELGKIISMQSNFCKNILSKKKFFFFEKKRKIDENSRLFSKKLGGGCILDLGCYPVSLTLLIASLIKDLDINNFKLKNIKKEIGFTNVEVDAEIEIHFENGFTSKVKSSFKKSRGLDTIIFFEKGYIQIKNTWIDNIEVLKFINGRKELFKNNLNRNIYSYEISQISKSILENKNNLYFPGMTINETMLNTKILESWLNV